MKLPLNLPLYGDTSFRGDCPSENVEHVTFFNRIRRLHPTTWGLLAIHPRNEGQRDFRRVSKEKAEGMVTGAPDIIIPGSPAFLCELKRRDHTKCRLGPEQEAYLDAAREAGAFVCVALGVDAAMEAFNDYLARRQAAK